MKLFAALFGAAPAAVAAEPPPAIVAPVAAPEFPPPQIVAETVGAQAFGGDFPQPAAVFGSHPAEAVLDQMVRAFQAGLVIHGDDRSAMADALMALRAASIRTPEFTGPGKRHASAKAERRFRAVLDALILNGTGEPTGWRAPDGQPFA